MFEEWLHASAISVFIPWGGPRFFDELTILTLCMLGFFSCFYCRLLFFSKLTFFKRFFQEHYQSVKQFGSRSGPTKNVGSDLSPNVFKGYRQTTKVATSIERVHRQNTLRIATVQIE